MTLRRVRLVPETEDMLQCMESPRQFARRYSASIKEAALIQLRGLVRQSIEFYGRIQAVPPWTGYITIAIESNQVVGCCGFKGNPSADGSAEIAYYTLPEHEGQGYASAAAVELVEIACESPEVRTVMAETLAERNASCRILEKAGFQCHGDRLCDEDGRVWQWRYVLPRYPTPCE